MSILSDIIKITTEAHKLWQSNKTAKAQINKNVFESYLKPSYELLKEIHNDYLDLYLKLESRIIDPKTKPSELLKWFSQKRTNRTADRSELRAWEYPVHIKSVKQKKDEDFDNVLESYLIRLRDYFLPSFSVAWSDLQRKMSLSANVSRSKWTEFQLYTFFHWDSLNSEDKRTLLVSQNAFHGLYFSDDRPPNLTDAADLMERLLNAASGDYLFDKKGLEGIEESKKNFRPQLEINEYKREPHSNNVDWRMIIRNHAIGQRIQLEHKLQVIQQDYMKAKILAGM